MSGRAPRYLAVYLALLAVLAAVRYETRSTYPALIALRDREDALELRRQQLTLDVQRLQSAARVRAWAKQNGMVPYSTARHDFQALPALPDVPAAKAPAKKLEVRTEWR